MFGQCDGGRFVLLLLVENGEISTSGIEPFHLFACKTHVSREGVAHLFQTITQVETMLHNAFGQWAERLFLVLRGQEVGLGKAVHIPSSDKIQQLKVGKPLLYRDGHQQHLRVQQGRAFVFQCDIVQ